MIAHGGNEIRIIFGYFVPHKIRENIWARISYHMELYTATAGSLVTHFKRATPHSILFLLIRIVQKKIKSLSFILKEKFSKDCVCLLYNSISWNSLSPTDSKQSITPVMCKYA